MTLTLLLDDPSRFALYDAGPGLARQVRAMRRALGRDDNIEMPDFTMRALLTGDEIASILGERAGPRIGQLKRALLEAQLRGDVRTREEAKKWLVVSC